MDIKELRADLEKKKKRRMLLVGLFVVVVFISLQAQKLLVSELIVERAIIELSKVRRDNFSVKVVASGQFKAKTKSTVSAPQAGRVVRIDVRAGQEVVSGDALLTIENKGLTDIYQKLLSEVENATLKHEVLLTKLELELIREQQELQKVEGDLMVLQARYAAKKKLAENNIVSNIELLETKIRLDVLQKQIEVSKKTVNAMSELAVKEVALSNLTISSTKQALASAQSAVSSLNINSEASGVIQDIAVQLGAFVEQGVPLATLTKLDDIVFIARVSEREANLIKHNDEAKIYAGTIEIASAVSEISSKVDNGQVEVMLQAEKPRNLDVRQGLSAQTEIVVSKINDTLIVKQPPYTRSNMEYELWIENTANNTLQRRIVKFGAQSGSEIQVISGLSEGDKIVTSKVNDEWKNYSAVVLTP